MKTTDERDAVHGTGAGVTYQGGPLWNALGSTHNAVEIVTYRDQWPLVFAVEQRRLHQACAGLLTAVEHIGSTAVPGLSAKPVLDLLLGLTDREHSARLLDPMTALGYEYRGEHGITGRHFFVLQRRGMHIVHAHACTMAGPHWRRHLFLRDYLRAHPDSARAYETLKRALAARHPRDREAYSRGKAGFIEAIEQLTPAS